MTPGSVAIPWHERAYVSHFEGHPSGKKVSGPADAGPLCSNYLCGSLHAGVSRSTFNLWISCARRTARALFVLSSAGGPLPVAFQLPQPLVSSPRSAAFFGPYSFRRRTRRRSFLALAGSSCRWCTCLPPLLWRTVVALGSSGLAILSSSAFGRAIWTGPVLAPPCNDNQTLMWTMRLTPGGPGGPGGFEHGPGLFNALLVGAAPWLTRIQ